jgi:hypothetical protein
MNDARLSSCGRYRYELKRSWTMDVEKRYCLFVMLNPSTADATVDDPTIRRCIAFAKAWGYDALTVGNLYALRATDPAELWTVADPVGPENDERLAILASYARVIVAAWGANARIERVSQVLPILERFGRVHALKTTKHGQPCHPLYLPGGLKPSPFPTREQP